MTASHANDIVNGYMARLENETRDLPGREQRELLDGMREHIDEARAAYPNETDADILNLLDRLGSPEEVAIQSHASLPVSLASGQAAPYGTA